jgi:hypothetical protein
VIQQCRRCIVEVTDVVLGWVLCAARVLKFQDPVFKLE